MSQRSSRTLTPNLEEIAPNLELGPDGWWISRRMSDVSYPEDGNATCFAVEESSFWFEHRNHCILQALKSFPPPGVLFDVGGGNGFVAQAIQESGLGVVLVEPGPAGARNASRRGIGQVIRATLKDAGVLPESLPAVGLFDVVEHIGDDLGFLTHIHQLLIPGGRLYVTVPAYQWLWSGEDVSAAHERRYALPALRHLLDNAGFSIEFATYFFGFLPLPIFFRRVLPYRLGFAVERAAEAALRSDHQLRGPLIGRVLELLNRRELSKIAQQRSLLLGGSCMAVAQKL